MSGGTPETMISAPLQRTPTESSAPARLRLDLLNLDGSTQVRATINDSIVQEYAERIQAGDKFPAVVVFFDGEHHWLGDGFHRVRAAAAIGREEIEVDLRQGTREDAVWYACAANQAHGLRRSNADKRRAVEVALRSPKAQALSDRAIAGHCGVSHNFVSEVRRGLELSSDDSCPRLGRDGKLRATSSTKRSEAAKARAEQCRELVEQSPPVPPPPTPLRATPPPLALSLFGPESSAQGSMRARRRRKMPLRRVLGAALMLSPEEQQALRRQMKWHVEDEESGSEGSLPPTSGGDRGAGCL